MTKLGWQPGAAGSELDALVALGLLRRDRAGRYCNSRLSALFLDPAKPTYLGGLIGLSSKGLFSLWSGLGDLLQTGRAGAAEEATLIAARFPWKRFRSFVVIGGAQGALPVRVALTHPHLTGASYDLAAVGPIFDEYVGAFALSDRLRFIPGDIHTGPLPAADVICFGHVLHGYGEEKRRELIAKAFDVVPVGGAVIVYGAMVDPARLDDFASHLFSLEFMPETREGFEATTIQCAEWLRGAGFVDVKTQHMVGPTSMVFAFKPHRLHDES
jgi:hypothetical protein